MFPWTCVKRCELKHFRVPARTGWSNLEVAVDKQMLAVLIPVLAVFFAGLVALSRTAIGKALARRIGGDAGVHLDDHRLAVLEDDMDRLRTELMETQERLDFAERMLTRGRPESHELASPPPDPKP